MKRLITLGIILVLFVIACGGGESPGSAEFTSTPASEVVDKAEAEPSPTKEPPSSTKSPSAAATSTQSSGAGESTTGNTVKCSLDDKQQEVACQADGYTDGTDFSWTSNATSRTSGGQNFIFPIENLVSIILVEVEVCRGSSCELITISIDASHLVDESEQNQETEEGDTSSRTASNTPTKTPTSNQNGSTTETSKPTPEPQRLFMLPFTSEHVPRDMLPMGETIHHAREAPWGHPGIDFIWGYKVPLVIVLSGEVAQIIEFESKKPGLPNYIVSVITNEFIVNYEVIEIYSINPSLDVGSQVVAGQIIGYATPVDASASSYMTHWELGTYVKDEDPKPNPEGLVMQYHTHRLCPVPYLTEPEQQRLFRIWEKAGYNERDQFPDLCNGPFKNY